MRPWPGSCGKSVAPSWWPWAPCWERPGSIVPRASRITMPTASDRPWLPLPGGRTGCAAPPALRDPPRLHAGLVPLAEALQTNKTQLAGPLSPVDGARDPGAGRVAPLASVRLADLRPLAP